MIEKHSLLPPIRRLSLLEDISENFGFWRRRKKLESAILVKMCRCHLRDKEFAHKACLKRHRGFKHSEMKESVTIHRDSTKVNTAAILVKKREDCTRKGWSKDDLIILLQRQAIIRIQVQNTGEETAAIVFVFDVFDNVAVITFFESCVECFVCLLGG